MNIQNNRAAEVLYSTTYVEDYLDTVETLPDEIQRLVTRLIGLDADAQTYVQKVRDYFAQLVRLNKRNKRNGNEALVKDIGRVHGHITVTLMKSQEIGDEKIQVAQQIQDFVDNRLRQLEIDRKTLDSVQKQADAAEAAATSSFSSRDSSHQRNNPGGESSTSDRGIKRVRRVRLGPSIMPHKPELTATSGVSQVTPVSEKRSEGISSIAPSKHEAPSSAPSAPHVEKVKEKVKSSSHHTPTSTTTPASSSQENRKDSSAASTSTGVPTKKQRATEVSEAVASTSAQVLEPEIVEKKSEIVLRTPKKKEKKVQAQKTSERKAASAGSSSSTTTKRTAAKRKTQQVGAFADVDPDEPTYCVCDQISYGDMIGCDNDLCPIEWFHFSCVQLSIKPKGKWYCPTCRDGKPNVMKTKEAFLKELEKYNREREGR